MVAALSGGILAVLAACAPAVMAAAGQGRSDGDSPYGRWRNGLSPDPAHFPIGVWLQNPANAARYRAAGINLYVGLWKGPTEEQLQALERAGMRVICDQNAVGLRNRDNRTIAGWMHGDEPDNAQPMPGGGYGPPIPPERIIADYQRIRTWDPTRPVLLNLGQGVAWDGWHGRGARTNHPEDYPEYVKGGDIVSFDIYPAVHSHRDVRGRLWMVGEGVARLRRWAGPGRIVWNVIEAARIDNPDVEPTPEQVRAEVWMSLVRGSQGIVYFVHQFKPVFKEAALLENPRLLAAVTSLNAQIRRLAPVLNGSGDAREMQARGGAVRGLLKRIGSAAWLFAVNERGAPASVRFELPGGTGAGEAEVLDEERRVAVQGGVLEDSFGPWAVHLYRLVR